MAAFTTRWTTTTLQTLGPMMLAVQGDAPIAIFIAALTSLWVGVPLEVTRLQAVWAHAGIDTRHRPRLRIAQKLLRIKSILLNSLPALETARTGPVCTVSEATKTSGFERKHKNRTSTQVHFARTIADREESVIKFSSL